MNSAKGRDAAKRIEIQKHLKKELNLFLQQRKSDLDFGSQSLYKKRLDGSEKFFSKTKEKEALREWLLMPVKKIGAFVPNSSLFSGADGLEEGIIQGILYPIQDMDIAKDAAFKDDVEFVSNYGRVYGDICRIAAADVLLDKYLACPKDESEIVLLLNMTAIRAKIEFAKKMKEKYDARMAMISSPYYAIVDRKEISQYLGQDGAAKLRQAKEENKISEDMAKYIELVRKAETARNMEGANAAEEYQSILMEMANLNYKEVLQKAQGDLAYFSDSLQAMRDAVNKPDAANNKTIGVVTLFEEKRKRIKDSFPKDDMEFLSQVESTEDTVGEIQIYALKAKHLKKYDKEFRTIFLENEFRGQQIAEEDQAEVKRLIGEFVKARREMMGFYKPYMMLIRMMAGVGYDMSNPKFQEHQEYKDLSVLVGESFSKEVDVEFLQRKNQFGAAFYNIIKFLIDRGFTVNAERENISKEEQEEFIQRRRDQRRADDKKVKEGEEFPRIEVNGKSYMMYRIPAGTIGKQMKNRSVTRYSIEDKKEAAEVDRILKEIEDAGVKFEIYRERFNKSGRVKFLYDICGKKYIRILESKEKELEKKLAFMKQVQE